MPSYPRLTLAFLERQPQSAAKVMEELDPEDAAAFLESVPTRLSGPVVSAMAPWQAARCVALLGQEHAAGLMRRMSYQNATSVLRLLPDERREEIFEELPNRLAKDFQNSLRYPTGTVGAWMDQDVPGFPADSSVADGLKYARQRRNKVGSHLFVLDEGGRFAGAVSLGDLLRNESKAPLTTIMDRSVQPLSNRAMLYAVASLPAWDDYPMLPVVGRRKNLLGGLARTSLREGLSENRMIRNSVAAQSIWAHLSANYLLACSGLLHFLTRQDLPQQDAIREEYEHDR